MVSSKWLNLTFLTWQKKEIKSITKQLRQLETGKCQGPRKEVSMQAASQLLMALINKCRLMEEKVTVQTGGGSVFQPTQGIGVLGCSKGQSVLHLFPPHLCKTQ